MTSARRRELITMIKEELEGTKYHADHSTTQLRHNIKKSIGNAKIDALTTWLGMLRNVKGETFYKKKIEGIRATCAQPITNFFVGWIARRWKTFLFYFIFYFMVICLL